MSTSHPGNLLPANRALDLVCPACHGELSILPHAYSCTACAREYTVHQGIPDFRLFPDPYLSVEEDAARADMVASLLLSTSLEQLLDHYWSVSDVTPVHLRKRFVRSALVSEKRSERLLDLLPGGSARARLLDVGSGTGGLLLAAARRGHDVVGADIAMRWLQVSRRRFLDAAVPTPPLVCAAAEALPFRSGTFQRIMSVSTLEFTHDAAASFREAARVLATDGAYVLSTVNRYSLTYDPYAYLRFVGFLPRSLQQGYVAWRRKAQWFVRELSLNELDRLARASFRSREYRLPDIDDDLLNEFSPAIEKQVRTYRKLKRLRLTRPLLMLSGPGWELVLQDPRGVEESRQ